MDLDWASQSGFDPRFDWGSEGARRLRACVVVVVDVLRFSTAVEAACSRGIPVIPHPWRDASARDVADRLGARLAEGADGPGPCLSPVSMLGLSGPTPIVLPSPNGAECAIAAAATGATVLAGCLRNAGAVATAALAHGGPVAVVACGERWPDGALRPSLEDLLGAGAVLEALEGTPSPEATAAVGAWREVRGNLRHELHRCASGRELLERGRGEDVDYAAEALVSDVVPVLVEGAFRPWMTEAPAG